MSFVAALAWAANFSASARSKVKGAGPYSQALPANVCAEGPLLAAARQVKSVFSAQLCIEMCEDRRLSGRQWWATSQLTVDHIHKYRVIYCDSCTYSVRAHQSKGLARA